jgi:ribosomal protein S18 acetylase RimI-like enzyme
MALVQWDSSQKESFLRSQFQLQSAHYHRYYQAASYLLILAEGSPVGRLYVDRTPQDIHILDIALMLEYRGAGIGSVLMKELLEEAAASNRTVTLYVERFNPAQKLYLGLGFEPIKDEGVYFLMQWRPDRSSAAEQAPPDDTADSHQEQ